MRDRLELWWENDAWLLRAPHSGLDPTKIRTDPMPEWLADVKVLALVAGKAVVKNTGSDGYTTYAVAFYIDAAGAFHSFTGVQ